MNILVFSWRDPKHPLAGGAEQVMHEHMKGWVEKGYTVTLFSSKMPGLAKKEILDGVEIVRGGYQYLGVQLSGFIYYLRNKKKYDFVVDQFHGIPFFTPLYSQLPKLAVIQEPAHEVWFKNPLPLPFNLLIGLVGYLTEPMFFFFYKRIQFMTGSSSAKENLKKYGVRSKNITVVPHGVIGPKKKVKTEKEKVKTIVHLGVLAKDKGIEDTIEVFYLLNKRGNHNFWVIGRPETERYFSFLKKIVKKHNLEGKIKFWGYVSDEKKFELLSKSHLLINPSVHEGWGLVNIEASLVGVPVIAYNSSGLVDSVQGGFSGIICSENKPNVMANAVLTILNNPKEYKRLSDGALSWSGKFDWGKSRAMSLKLIHKIYAK